MIPAGWQLAGSGAALKCLELPVPHGFSTRLGGVSSGAFATLNLDGTKGDRPEHVAENRDRFQRAAGLSGRWHSIDQTHSNHVLILDGSHPQDPARRGDALVACEPGLPLAVAVADCTPVLISHRDGHVVGAVHSGWRGTAGNIVTATVNSLRGCRPADLIVAIGPAAGGCCYEVGFEVVEALRAADPGSAHGDPGWLLPPGQAARKPHVDIPTLITCQLMAAGVPATSIFRCPVCTICHADLCFSYRRDGPVSGRMVAAIEAIRRRV